MPFKAAKALAATFCWDIRYALTPIFGPDFVSTCTHPEDPAFRRYTVNQEIVGECAASSRPNKNHNASRRHPLPKAKKEAVEETATPLLRQVQTVASTRVRRSCTTFASVPVHSSDDDESDTDTDDDDPTDHQALTVQPPSSQPAPSSAFRNWAHAQRRASSSASTPTTTTHRKRTFSSLDGEDGNAPSSTNTSGAPSSGAAPSEKKKQTRAVHQFRSDEARAAYMLLQLSVADRASVRG